MKNRTRRSAILLAALLSLGFGLVGSTGIADADIDDLGICQPDDIDDHSCDTPDPEPDPNFDPIDDFTSCSTGDVEDISNCDFPDDPEEPGTPDVDDGSLPPAPVGDVVVADPNFTG